MGADDYLTKDASMPHLLARISALFRRADLAARAAGRRGTCSSAARCTLDMKRFIAHVERTAVDLTLTEFWLVHSLARFPGHVKDREQLMRDAHIVVDDATITSHMKRIRRKFQAVDPAVRRDRTVYGMGYRWKA